MLMLILDFHSQRWDLNHVIAFVEKPKYFISFSKIWWSMMSDAFCKSIKTVPVKRYFSNLVVILSVRGPRKVFAE